MDITHRQKVDHLIEELGRQGVSPYKVAPRLFRLLWALGFEVPPPLFLGFGKLALLAGVSFGVLWGVGMWSWQWHELGLVGSLVVGVPTTVVAGLLFGVFMVVFMRWRTARFRAQFGLPSSWEDYPQA